MSCRSSESEESSLIGKRPSTPSYEAELAIKEESIDGVVLRGLPSVGLTCYLGVITKFFEAIAYHSEPELLLSFFDQPTKDKRSLEAFYQENFGQIYQVKTQNDPMEAFSCYLDLLGSNVKEQVTIKNKQTVRCSCNEECISLLQYELLEVNLNLKAN